MNKANCALKLVDEIILYYDARSKKHEVCNNVDIIQDRAKTGSKARAKRIPYSRCSTMANMEKMLSTWIKAQNRHEVPVQVFGSSQSSLYYPNPGTHTSHPLTYTKNSYPPLQPPPIYKLGTPQR